MARTAPQRLARLRARYSGPAAPVALFAVVSTIPVSTLHDETSDSGLWITVAVALGVVVATYVDTRPLLAFLAVASSCVLTVILIHDAPPAGSTTSSG
jgi:hypothetical protein